MPLDPAIREQIRADLVQFEASVPFMYLDTVGIVTVGIGFALRSEAEAVALPFLDDATDAAADPDTIAAAFRAVHAAQKGQFFQRYAHLTAIHLAEAEIRSLTDQKMDLFYAATTRPAVLPDFDTYPAAAQVAIFDMVWNLGGLSGYPRFCAAVRARDWRNAAAECGRNVGDHGFDARNSATRALLLGAA